LLPSVKLKVASAKPKRKAFSYWLWFLAFSFNFLTVEGRDGMRTNESFCYEPDKLAEYLICEFDIDSRFVAGYVG